MFSSFNIIDKWEKKHQQNIFSFLNLKIFFKNFDEIIYLNMKLNLIHIDNFDKHIYWVIFNLNNQNFY
jgi:hypothetical protein